MRSKRRPVSSLLQSTDILSGEKKLVTRACHDAPRPLVVSTDRPRRSHSQLQDEDDIRLVLKDLVQGDDVGVVDLLQDVHLALDVLPGNAAATGLAAPLLDELGSELHARASVSASSHHSKLTAGRRRKKEGEEKNECEWRWMD